MFTILAIPLYLLSVREIPFYSYVSVMCCCESEYVVCFRASSVSLANDAVEDIDANARYISVCACDYISLI